MHGFDLPPGPLGPHSSAGGLLTTTLDDTDADHMGQQHVHSLPSAGHTAQHHHHQHQQSHHHQPHNRQHYQHSDGSSSNNSSGGSNMSQPMQQHNQPECADTFVTYPDSEDDDSMPAGSP